MKLGKRKIKARVPHFQTPRGAFFKLLEKFDTPSDGVVECCTQKTRVGSLQHLANRQTNVSVSLPPPLREIQYLYFPASEKRAEHDLSRENYRPAYYETDVLPWHSAFSLHPQIPVTAA